MSITINITEYGAKPDGTLQTSNIQKALDACFLAGGGKVVVPAGNYYCGTIWLKDNVELHLESGAKLIASTNLQDYNESDAYPQNWDCLSEHWLGKHLIIAHEVKNVSITGHGIIDGCGDAYWGRIDKNLPWQEGYVFRDGFTRTKDLQPSRPGQVICFIECENVNVTDITIQNCPCWACFFHGCEMVQVRGLKVLNPSTYANTDGIDIDCCRFVTVSDCIIKTGDDCITLRCSAQRLTNGMDTCKNITITNCVLECAVCAFRIGVGYGKIRNAAISNITVSRCGPVFKFMTSYSGRGEAFIENINISNITAENSGKCISIEAPIAGYVKDVSFSNFRAHLFASVHMTAKEKGMIKNINFTDLHLISENADYPVGEKERDCRGDAVAVRNGGAHGVGFWRRYGSPARGVRCVFGRGVCDERAVWL